MTNIYISNTFQEKNNIHQTFIKKTNSLTLISLFLAA
jgi:hypothetical protein